MFFVCFYYLLLLLSEIPYKEYKVFDFFLISFCLFFIIPCTLELETALRNCFYCLMRKKRKKRRQKLLLFQCFYFDFLKVFPTTFLLQFVVFFSHTLSWRRKRACTEACKLLTLAKLSRQSAGKLRMKSFVWDIQLWYRELNYETWKIFNK